MIETLTRNQFIDAFKQSDRKNQFSYEGLVSLFEYLEEYEDSTGETIEFDMIALCCEYAEYDNLEEFQNDYGKEYQSFDDIEEETTVIYYDSSEPHPELPFIIQQF